MSEAEQLMELCNRLMTEVGDCPNVEWETMGGMVFWKTLENKMGIRLQRNYLTGYCRILNDSDIRIAWGSENVMKEKFRRLTADSFLNPGDIIGVTRNSAMRLYDHYAVYLGDDQVIHYCGEGGDFTDNITIHKANIGEFMKSDHNFFVLYFEDTLHAPKKIFYRSDLLSFDKIYENQLIYEGSGNFELYSPEETIARAQSRIGEKEYNLVTNNCEHFALWCKTGVAASFQVARLCYSQIPRINYV